MKIKFIFSVILMLIAVSPAFSQKKTLREKLEDVQSAGMKVAVVFTSSKVGIERIPSGIASCPPPLEETTDLIGDYDDLMNIVVDEFNKGFGLSALERLDLEGTQSIDKVVDYINLAEKRNWKEEGYPIVFLISAVGTFQDGIETYPTSRFSMKIKLSVLEVVEGKSSMKILFTRTVGNEIYTDMVSHTECHKTIDDYLSVTSSTEALVGQSTALFEEQLPSIIARENKKYDKAMKKKK